MRRPVPLDIAKNLGGLRKVLRLLRLCGSEQGAGAWGAPGQDGGPQRPSGYRSALGERDLRFLFGGLVVSATGSWAYNVALLAFVFDRTHSLASVGAAGLVRFVPALALSAYGGVIAERTERVRLMLGADLVCAVWQGALAVVAAAGGPLALALAFGALTAASHPVSQQSGVGA